jgi:NAD(P)-dependent dehydrogenase (short-subunit alcohol dehydrogenase family)
MSCVAWYGLAIAIVATIVFLILERIPVSGTSTKPVLITGCDTGFGHELALKLARNGVPVYAACLVQKGVDELLAKSKHLPGKIDAFIMDVTKDESVNAARDYVMKTTTGLWGLVNNAGILGTNGPVDWLDVKHYQTCLDVNILGIIRVTHAFAPLIKRRQGRIVNTASIAGRVSFPTSAPYSISKYCVEAYSDCLRMEMNPFGVSVSILEPGFFKTNLLDAKRAEADTSKLYENMPQETKDEYGAEFLKLLLEQRTKRMTEMASERIEYVVDDYYSALMSRFPRTRYHPGWDSKLFFIPFSMAPTCVQTFLLRLIFIATKAPLPAAAVMKKIRLF